MGGAGIDVRGASGVSLGAANTFTVGPQTIQTGAAGNKGLIVKGAAGQSASLFEIQDSTGAGLLDFGEAGLRRIDSRGGVLGLNLGSTFGVKFGGSIDLSGLNIITDATTGTKIGTATNQKLAFYNATPVVQGASVAGATDAASAITQLNALISRIGATGLIATV